MSNLTEIVTKLNKIENEIKSTESDIKSLEKEKVKKLVKELKYYLKLFTKEYNDPDFQAEYEVGHLKFVLSESIRNIEGRIK